MTKRERMIVSAYTGVLMGTMPEFHEWVEEYLGHPVWTHDFSTQEFWEDLRTRTSKEFMELCSGGILHSDAGNGTRDTLCESSERLTKPELK